MKDFFIISLLFTIFSFFNTQLHGQESTSKGGEKNISFHDEDDFVGPRLPTPSNEPPPTPTRRTNKTRTVNLETINDNGVENTIITVIDHNGEVSILEWQGSKVPTDIADELKRMRINMSTLNRLAAGEKLRSKYKFEKRQPDSPEMELVVEEVRNIDGKEFTIHLNASKDGHRKKVTISGPDSSEKSYRWDGSMPDTIRDELSRLEPSLLSLVNLGEAIPLRVSLGMALSHEIKKEMTTSSETLTEVYRIDQIRQNGPAEKAGLQVGDELLELDGNTLSGEHAVSELLSQKQVGESIKVTYLRMGTQMEVTVRLQAKS